ncbi:MAG TPA: class I SAM-dependent methyltransferase [Lachnospiraceae bacterium]|nr:class I SAM-dependent methyltransferase [Lachnospiraceae bacterium]
MGIIQGLEWTFDTVASTYEKLRPGYSDELYEMLFDYSSICQSSNVVEVGIGGGQTTLPILKTGCNLTAVEYGEQFSRLCKDKFISYPNFSVVTNKFENTNFEDDAYDLVYSASAFHWVPEEIGYKKVFSMLKTGGVFARLANQPYRAKVNPALSADIDKVYGLYYYKFYNKKQEIPKEYTEEQAENRAMIAEK